MDYLIKISPTATLQLNQIVKYISQILLVPETAKKWLDVIEKAILSLDTLPNRHPLTEEEPWRTKGIRKMIVKGFIVYYWVNESTKTVTITAVIYGKKDQLNALKETEI